MTTLSLKNYGQKNALWAEGILTNSDQHIQSIQAKNGSFLQLLPIANAGRSGLLVLPCILALVSGIFNVARLNTGRLNLGEIGILKRSPYCDQCSKKEDV